MADGKFSYDIVLFVSFFMRRIFLMSHVHCVMLWIQEIPNKLNNRTPVVFSKRMAQAIRNALPDRGATTL